jgi:hypothetical protein
VGGWGEAAEGELERERSRESDREVVCGSSIDMSNNDVGKESALNL